MDLLLFVLSNIGSNRFRCALPRFGGDFQIGQ
jgi:hypothetical protein